MDFECRFQGNELDFWELYVSGEEYSKISKKKRQIKNMCMMAKMLYIFCKAISTFCKCTTGQDVTCGQVWCPILGICALHLTHPSAHTHSSEKWTNTHTHGAVGSQCCGAQGAVGGLVPCSRVSPQSWYWGWRESCTFTPPTYNPCRPETRTRNLQVTSPTL